MARLSAFHIFELLPGYLGSDMLPCSWVKLLYFRFSPAQAFAEVDVAVVWGYDEVLSAPLELLLEYHEAKLVGAYFDKVLQG